MPSANKPAPLVAVNTCTMLANGAVASTISASSTFSMYAPWSPSRFMPPTKIWVYCPAANAVTPAGWYWPR